MTYGSPNDEAPRNSPAVRIVTGPRDSGKTAWAVEYARTHPVRGLVSEKRFRENRLEGYDLLILPNGPGLPLAREAASPRRSAETVRPGWFSFRRFEFNQAAFDRAVVEARSAVDAAARGAVDPAGRAVFVVDEVGPLEVEGAGFRPLFDLILPSSLEIILTARPELIGWVRALVLDRPVELIRLSA